MKDRLEAENQILKRWAETVRNMEVYLPNPIQEARASEWPCPFYISKLRDAIKYSKNALADLEALKS